MISDLGEVNKAWGEACATDSGHKECRISRPQDIWQKSQDKEETNKANSATVLKSALTGQKAILTGGD